MKRIITIIAMLSCLSGCVLKQSHEPGGPYYFKYGVTYQGHHPTGEITEAEAIDLAHSGYAYYIAYFSLDEAPVKILKVYQGATNLYWKATEEK